MDNIILIGMPAAGKSTIGKILAEKMDCTFLDTDHLIENGEGKKLFDIISGSGLKDFCKLEEKYVLSVTGKGKIISTGGSVVYGKKAMAHLSSIGTIIFLSLNLSNLKSRLENLETRGVVISEGKTIDDLFNERTPLYDKYADHIVDCNNKSPLSITSEISTLFKIRKNL
ncbi:MAG: shikimate kinase [Deltaproteobacteria bacterium]|nr:shikimate kinase [Deltaproteobacteria bacterium]